MIRESVPLIWTDSIHSPMEHGITFGDYIARCEAVIQQCNADKKSIRTWSDAEK